MNGIAKPLQNSFKKLHYLRMSVEPPMNFETTMNFETPM